jgi:O-antigen/teichoic acid export membrane protein
MSVSVRLISGSIANGALLAGNILIQVISVPIMFGWWSAQQFGLWMLLQALYSLSVVFDLGHQNYLGYEFQRLGTREAVRLDVFSSVPAAILLGTAFLCFWTAVPAFGWADTLFGDFISAELMDDLTGSMIVHALTWLLTSSVGGVLGRALIPFGYYARMAWWRFALLVGVNLAALMAVVSGGNVLDAVIASSVANVVVNIGVHLDCFRLWRREKIGFAAPDLRRGWSNLARSLLVSLRELIVIANQQGIRLLIAPLAGVSLLGVFTATRTLSNIATQGINALAGPVEPELLRYLREGKSEPAEITVTLSWLFALVVVGPGCILLQWVAPGFFLWWTRGNFHLDPLLFGSLCACVLVYGFSQPLVSIVRGNNVLLPPIVANGVSLLITVIGCYLTLPSWGLPGAGLSLLAAEIASFMIYAAAARDMLLKLRLSLPIHAFAASACGCLSVIAGLFAMAILPQSTGWASIPAVIGSLLAAWMVYRSLPPHIRAILLPHVPNLTRRQAALMGDRP